MAIKEDNDRIRQRFISIDELLYRLGKQDHITEEEVATWLFNKNILDELPLFERNPSTLATTLVERQKILTRANTEKLISTLHSQSQQKLEQSLSIDNIDDFIKRNAEISLELIEKAIPIVSVADFLPLENHDEWDRKFIRYADLYTPHGNEVFNIGWLRLDLCSFLEKQGIALNPPIDYPTEDERKKYFKLKWLNLNPAAEDYQLEVTVTPRPSKRTSQAQRTDPVREVMLSIFDSHPQISELEMWAIIQDMATNKKPPFVYMNDSHSLFYETGGNAKTDQKELKRSDFSQRFGRLIKT